MLDLQLLSRTHESFKGTVDRCRLRRRFSQQRSRAAACAAERDARANIFANFRVARTVFIAVAANAVAANRVAATAAVNSSAAAARAGAHAARNEGERRANEPATKSASDSDADESAAARFANESTDAERFAAADARTDDACCACADDCDADRAFESNEDSGR